MTSVESSRLSPSHPQRLRALARRAVAIERTIYASIARAIARRPDLPAGAKGFRYHAPVATILWIFIVLSAVELVVVDLIVHRWPVVRIACLVLGIWGLVWMIGLLCGYVMRPHAVGPVGVRIRNGLDLDVPVNWDAVHAVGIAKHTYEPKTPKIVERSGDHAFVMPILNETNIEIELEHPTPLTLPGSAPKGGEHAVTVVRLWADDPKAFLAEVARHI